jgi:alkanesulfonate monooxygenase SsuD/methylene tetrahydromethanopterin reductase-like flavin-dependent oxidoreductase (luciferase family)
MKVGIQLPEVEYEVGWGDLIAMAQTAEAVGFDSLWLGDHLLYDVPGVGPRGPWEVWTSLAALAAATTTIQLGPLVASTGFHAPAMLAKMAATVDGISAGRLVVGLGAGWNEREYRAFGFPFDRRVDRFEEAFTIIRTLLRAGRCTFNGQYYSVDDCVLHPPPTKPGGPPLLLGSTGRRMLTIALPHVSAWNVWWSDYGNDPAQFAAVRAIVENVAAEHGIDVSTVEATAAVYVQLPDGHGRPMGDAGARSVPPVTGPPAAIAEHLDAMAVAGADAVQLVVDPITIASVEWLRDVLGLLGSP